jgi:SNF2 family DNA or RNA helicase
MDVKPPLRSYQRAGVMFLQSHPRAYLADDPGLG